MGIALAPGLPAKPEILATLGLAERVRTALGSWPFACRQARALLRRHRNTLPELLGKPDQQSFGPADVAEPIRVLVLDHFADELRATLAEPGERLVEVVDGEHDA